MTSFFQVVVIGRRLRRVDSFWATYQLAQMRVMEMAQDDTARTLSTSTAITIEEMQGWDQRVQTSPKRGWPAM